ncbi:MAG: hypothetical protein CL764_04215 [Chloroflexi bacterium]|nr:hypothetical protein [Chloroflexota bacterium]|tara:strand:- start:1015 stop:1233 length:219 start_codon:yes stop_codon:yes gene_type:complete
MTRLNTLNIYLGEKRKYLLIALNVVLIIFIFLEMMVWNQVNGLLSAEEVQEKMNRFCENSKATSCSYGRGTR